MILCIVKQPIILFSCSSKENYLLILSCNLLGKTPKNAGQIMKELLVKSSVDICKYKSPYGVQLTENEGFIIRRKKRRYTKVE